MIRSLSHIDHRLKREPKGKRECLNFPRGERIKKRRDYQAAYNYGQKKVGFSFVLYWRRNGFSHHRLGITVSKKIGHAVVRNRVKRIFRESFRQMRPPVQKGIGIDFVLVARQKIRHIPTRDFVEEYRRLLFFSQE